MGADGVTALLQALSGLQRLTSLDFQCALAVEHIAGCACALAWCRRLVVHPRLKCARAGTGQPDERRLPTLSDCPPPALTSLVVRSPPLRPTCLRAGPTNWATTASGRWPTGCATCRSCRSSTSRARLQCRRSLQAGCSIGLAWLTMGSRTRGVCRTRRVCHLLGLISDANPLPRYLKLS
jgi:hypothetical protein